MNLLGVSQRISRATPTCKVRSTRPQGTDTVGLARRDLREFRKRVQLIFQDPYSSLNPHRSVGQIVGEPFIVHRLCRRTEVRERVAAMLELVNLPAGAMGKLPHELSGGQRQRVAIARALALSPRLVVCDEPVSALDMSIRSQIVNLLLALQKKLGLSYLFIAHDLSLVMHVSDRIAVMYLGKIVEMAAAGVLAAQHRHPYAEALLSAVPVPQPGAKRGRIILVGEVPSALNPPSGCRFRTRCPIAVERCAQVEPVLREASSGHTVACHLRV